MVRIPQSGALMLLGVILISLQLVIVHQLSKHTTVIDQTTALSLHRIPAKKTVSVVWNATSSATMKRRPQAAPSLTPADGTFNGIPIHFHNAPMEYSTVACVGDNYQKDAWLYRSCQFRHFCFDTEDKLFVLVQSPQERQWLRQYAHSDSFIGTAINTNISISLGGLNVKWGTQAFPKLKWFPRILEEPIAGYYQLPDDYVWVPYHSMAGFNAGHLVWDDFLPIYTLLTMFGLIGDGSRRQPLLTRYILTEPLWASCDFSDELKSKCIQLTPKFLPLMGIEPRTFSTTQDFRFETPNKQQSKYVCARYGAAGIGMLTDHATKTHGWEPRDYKTTHNVGRGAAFYNFRNLMMNNMKISTAPLSPEPPFHITFSANSSQSTVRSLHFQQQVQAVEKSFSRNEAQLHVHSMKTLSLKDQLSLASKSAIFVTSAGGGAVTATFLPRGASLILYYQSDGSRVNNRRTFQPARLDWDYFNHLSYIRVHWLPANDMNTPQGIETFTRLIRNELDAIARG